MEQKQVSTQSIAENFAKKANEKCHFEIQCRKIKFLPIFEENKTKFDSEVLKSWSFNLFDPDGLT